MTISYFDLRQIVDNNNDDRTTDGRSLLSIRKKYCIKK